MDTPLDYVAIKIAAAKMFPKLADAANDLARRASAAGRLRPLATPIPPRIPTKPLQQAASTLLHTKLAANPLATVAAHVGNAAGQVGKAVGQTGPWGHAAELAGLGILARPSIQKLRGKQVTHRSEAGHELVGLGTLAAPSAYHLLTRH